MNIFLNLLCNSAVQRFRGFNLTLIILPLFNQRMRLCLFVRLICNFVIFL